MDLRSRFYALWTKLDAKGSPQKAFDDLLSRYQEPHRYYHNASHLEFGLSQFDYLADLAKHPDWVEFAYFYHDSVYAIGADDNEDQSAKLAIKVLGNAGVRGWCQIHVGSYIMATKPGSQPKRVDEQIISDIDLAILGQPRPVFAEYEKQVRQEYIQVPEEVFWRRRKEILDGFLRRPRIFSTSRFRDLYEEQARRNLEWTIAQH